MELNKIGFPAVLEDNELAYYSMLQAVIESVDELASMRITRKPTAVSFILVPSTPKYSQPLLQEVLSFHRVMGLKLNLSKSIRTTTTIQFEISFGESI
jgi:hypothetical protein